MNREHPEPERAALQERDANRLREELARLQAENAGLRAALASTTPSDMLPLMERQGRRSRGRMISILLLALGLGTGIWYFAEMRRDVARGFHENFDPATSTEVRVAPPTPAPPPPPAP